MVGRFAAQKNPEFLLECFAEYNKLNKARTKFGLFKVWTKDCTSARTT